MQLGVAITSEYLGTPKAAPEIKFRVVFRSSFSFCVGKYGQVTGFWPVFTVQNVGAEISESGHCQVFGVEIFSFSFRAIGSLWLTERGRRTCYECTTYILGLSWPYSVFSRCLGNCK